MHNFVLADAAVPVFDFGASTFAEVMKTITFIDKMMVIKAIFKATYRLLITALCKFDKSTNLAMIRHFVEIQLDENGEPWEDNRVTQNYKLFTENKLKVSEVPAVMNGHFG